MKKGLKQIHVIVKTVCHCTLGLAEYVGIPLILALLSTYLAPITQQPILWQWIERTTFCFTVYEVILVGIRKMQIDIRKDALLALKTAYERAQLYCETRNTTIYNDLSEKIDRVVANTVLNQLDVLDRYNILKTYMADANVCGIGLEIIKIQHQIESDSLLWNYTLFLRLFKG